MISNFTMPTRTANNLTFNLDIEEGIEQTSISAHMMSGVLTKELFYYKGAEVGFEPTRSFWPHRGMNPVTYQTCIFRDNFCKERTPKFESGT